MVPLRGPASAPALEAWTLLAALAAQTRRAAARRDRDEQPAAGACAAGQDGGDRGHHLRRPAGVRHRSRGLASPLDLDEAAAWASCAREYDGYGVPILSGPPRPGPARSPRHWVLIRRMWTDPEPFDFEGKLLPAARHGVRAQAGQPPASADHDRRPGREADPAHRRRARRQSGTARPVRPRSSATTTPCSTSIAPPSAATPTRSPARSSSSCATKTSQARATRYRDSSTPG